MTLEIVPMFRLFYVILKRGTVEVSLASFATLGAAERYIERVRLVLDQRAVLTAGSK